jgi:ubiquinone/menaquinone biosynthesis C-methylase UbiE
MEHAEMVDLIRHGVGQTGGTWADLGAGTGNFTRALGELLGPQATIYAVDRSARALARLQDVPTNTTLVTLAGDFTRSLNLPMLDGILMANALHFVQNQAAVLQALTRHLHPGGRLLIVEYDLHSPVAWVPFPVPFDRLQALAPEIGLNTPIVIGRRRSPSSGIEMYAALAIRPGSIGRQTLAR